MIDSMEMNKEIEKIEKEIENIFFSDLNIR